MQPIYSKNDFITVSESGSISEDIFKRGLCLPSDIKMDIETQEKIINILKQIINNVGKCEDN